MKKIVFKLFAVLLLGSCNNKWVNQIVSVQTKSDEIYQYSVFSALANKVYTGNITVSQVKENGDIGLGTFNSLNGELIMLDGEVYQLLSDGTIRHSADTELLPFVVTTFFDDDQHLQLKECSAYEVLKGFIEKRLPSPNFFYGFRITGAFQSITCGGAEKQEYPFSKTLGEALVDRPKFQAENIKGTMVGFWFPAHTGKINIAGFHLHFISDDRKMAGHVMDFNATDMEIGIDRIDQINITLPQTEDFGKAVIDLSQEYSLAPAKGN